MQETTNIAVVALLVVVSVFGVAALSDLLGEQPKRQAQ